MTARRLLTVKFRPHLFFMFGIAPTYHALHVVFLGFDVTLTFQKDSD